ncbi:hypothetical protein SAMN05444064_12537 [Pseudomonas syringae]|uniref:hypothetical protein n=1 Tax=Pseudomonas syringae TaxID=317 RepID=UPI00089A50A4|nr:hypothetical protein [Pseudomonas syringae]SDX56292.1 hypothetical protein SAMN05444514_12637 [Pseudomonas syringae]SFM67163.1 hypothetical protein SAMN05444064_12537 [Pseudomonas syringae]
MSIAKAILPATSGLLISSRLDNIDEASDGTNEVAEMPGATNALRHKVSRG